MRQLYIVFLIYLTQTLFYSNNVNYKYHHKSVIKNYVDSIPKNTINHNDFRKENIHILSGKVLNGISLVPIPEASVIVYNSEKEVVSTVMTDGKGSFKVYVDDHKQYMLEYFHEDYNIRYKKLEKVNLKLPEYVNLYLDPGVGIELFMLEEMLDLSVIPHYIINSKYVLDLPNIYFDEDEYFLRKEFIPTLDEVIRLLNENKALKIEIASHTSSGAKDEYNIILSEHRAKNIYEYLIKKNVDAKKISFKGYGSLEPLIYNFEAQQKNGNDANRRIEFRIIF